ncbi:phosphoribosylamine--glycine ligase [Candidatus Roizmanbacteria bacterium]|nr:phosphoribosylamine--glycine ligase [Candidatus Roizmanbacteria bacterium]
MRKESKEVVVVIDGGGRGAALVGGDGIGGYAASPHVGEIHVIPGNDLAGFNTDKPVYTYPGLKTTDVAAIEQLCQEKNASLVDVAQDNAIEAGVVDALMRLGIPTVGPTRAAGRIESDKYFNREFGTRHNIPQARYKLCATIGEAVDYFNDELGGEKAFWKYRFLAAGKGAIPIYNARQIRTTTREFRKAYGNKARTFLLEEWIEGDDGTSGEEYSFFVVSDGKIFKRLGVAQDHKRAESGDRGPNTGGMGCSTWPLVLNEELTQATEDEIVAPTIAGLDEEGYPYKGVLYSGVMAVTSNGKKKPKEVEKNARHGDPETQVIIPGLQIDLFELGMAIAQGDISRMDIQSDGLSRVAIAGAARGYPGDYSAVRGNEIFNLDAVRNLNGVHLIGAAIKVQDGRYLADGGRLFYIVGEGANVIEARARALYAMALIHIEGNNLHYRDDIGWRDVERLHREGIIYARS